MTIGGTLPRRKPGTLICWAIFLYAASRLGLSSSKGTSTVSLARVGLKVSTALFTGLLLLFEMMMGGSGPGREEAIRPGGLRAAYLPLDTHSQLRSTMRARAVTRSGRQDSNLRSPAPKAGALATTLRPAK